MKKSAFTLIELLVVISIIAILASLAIPAYTKVMEKGKAVQDANNLRQFGLGIAGYTNDNNDSYFPKSGTGWPMLLNGTSGTVYVPAWKVFQSPFDNRPSSNNGVTSQPYSPVSYDINKYLMGASTSDVSSPSNCIVMSVNMANGTFVTNDASTAASSLGNLSKSSNLDSSNQPAGAFNGGIYLNVLFADSHVAAMRATLFCSGTGIQGVATSGSASGTTINLIWNALTN